MAAQAVQLIQDSQDSQSLFQSYAHLLKLAASELLAEVPRHAAVAAWRERAHAALDTFRRHLDNVTTSAEVIKQAAYGCGLLVTYALPDATTYDLGALLESVAVAIDSRRAELDNPTLSTAMWTVARVAPTLRAVPAPVVDMCVTTLQGDRLAQSASLTFETLSAFEALLPSARDQLAPQRHRWLGPLFALAISPLDGAERLRVAALRCLQEASKCGLMDNVPADLENALWEQRSRLLEVDISVGKCILLWALLVRATGARLFFKQPSLVNKVSGIFTKAFNVDDDKSNKTRTAYFAAWGLLGGATAAHWVRNGSHKSHVTFIMLPFMHVVHRKDPAPALVKVCLDVWTNIMDAFPDEAVGKVAPVVLVAFLQAFPKTLSLTSGAIECIILNTARWHPFLKLGDDVKMPKRDRVRQLLANGICLTVAAVGGLHALPPAQFDNLAAFWRQTNQTVVERTLPSLCSVVSASANLPDSEIGRAADSLVSFVAAVASGVSPTFVEIMCVKILGAMGHDAASRPLTGPDDKPVLGRLLCVWIDSLQSRLDVQRPEALLSVARDCIANAIISHALSLAAVVSDTTRYALAQIRAPPSVGEDMFFALWSVLASVFSMATADLERLPAPVDACLALLLTAPLDRAAQTAPTAFVESRHWVAWKALASDLTVLAEGTNAALLKYVSDSALPLSVRCPVLLWLAGIHRSNPGQWAQLMTGLRTLAAADSSPASLEQILEVVVALGQRVSDMDAGVQTVAALTGLVESWPGDALPLITALGDILSKHWKANAHTAVQAAVGSLADFLDLVLRSKNDAIVNCGVRLAQGTIGRSRHPLEYPLNLRSAVEDLATRGVVIDLPGIDVRSQVEVVLDSYDSPRLHQEAMVDDDAEVVLVDQTPPRESQEEQAEPMDVSEDKPDDAHAKGSDPMDGSVELGGGGGSGSAGVGPGGPGSSSDPMDVSEELDAAPPLTRGKRKRAARQPGPSSGQRHTRSSSQEKLDTPAPRRRTRRSASQEDLDNAMSRRRSLRSASQESDLIKHPVPDDNDDDDDDDDGGDAVLELDQGAPPAAVNNQSETLSLEQRTPIETRDSLSAISSPLDPSSSEPRKRAGILKRPQDVIGRPRPAKRRRVSFDLKPPTMIDPSGQLIPPAQPMLKAAAQPPPLAGLLRRRAMPDRAVGLHQARQSHKKAWQYIFDDDDGKDAAKDDAKDHSDSDDKTVQQPPVPAVDSSTLDIVDTPSKVPWADQLTALVDDLDPQAWPSAQRSDLIWKAIQATDKIRHRLTQALVEETRKT